MISVGGIYNDVVLRSIVGVEWVCVGEVEGQTVWQEGVEKLVKVIESYHSIVQQRPCKLSVCNVLFFTNVVSLPCEPTTHPASLTLLQTCPVIRCVVRDSNHSCT